MNFGDLFHQFQMKVENPSHLFQVEVVIYTRPSGILVGEVYDEKIIEACLHQGRDPNNQLVVNSN